MLQKKKLKRKGKRDFGEDNVKESETQFYLKCGLNKRRYKSKTI